MYMRMEEIPTKKLCHKEWRKIAKKERRRRIRRKTAQEREKEVECLMLALENTAEYILRQEEEKLRQQEIEEQEKQEHDEQEKLWIEAEKRNQAEWKIVQERKARARLVQAKQDELVRKEFEEKQALIRKQKDEELKRREDELRLAAALRKEIDDYIDGGSKTPEILRTVNESQPGKEICPFFMKTGACRYGNTCSRNHCKYSLSSVIVIPGFYSHFSMEKTLPEYDTDINLEYDKEETQVHFAKFFEDIVPELEKFGKLKTIQCCYNTESHLRGNLYVQYYKERDAARAQRNLSGRSYAGKQINCEFASIKSWNFAICGMRKCPKGKLCNYIHPYNNPGNKYAVLSPKRTNSIERTDPKNHKRTNSIERTDPKNHKRTNSIERTDPKNHKRTNSIDRTDSKNRRRTHSIERTDLEMNENTEKKDRTWDDWVKTEKKKNFREWRWSSESPLERRPSKS